MKIENAKMTITLDDPNELLDAMSGDEQIEFLESLSCQDAVIEFVLQQVFDGYTGENFCHGFVACTWNGNTPLQQFRKKLIEVGAEYTAKKRIEELERYCKSKDEYIEELLDTLYKMEAG